ncbi:MAG: hypothetical protein ACTSUE_27515 [Promethearchaeota archaeon]
MSVTIDEEKIKKSLKIIMRETTMIQEKLKYIFKEGIDDRFPKDAKSSAFDSPIPESMVEECIGEKCTLDVMEMVYHLGSAAVHLAKSIQETTVMSEPDDRVENEEMLILQARAFRLSVRLTGLDRWRKCLEAKILI